MDFFNLNFLKKERMAVFLTSCFSWKQHNSSEGENQQKKETRVHWVVCFWRETEGNLYIAKDFSRRKCNNFCRQIE